MRDERVLTSQQVDAVLVRVRQGDTEAYEQIVRRYQDDVWRSITPYVANNGETDELVQQAFVAGFTALSDFELGRDFGAWIKTIARNLVRKRLRGQTRETRRLKIYREYLQARLKAEDEGESREAALEDAIKHCREELSGDAEQAIRLRYDDNLDESRVALHLGRTVTATRQLLYRVRLLLKDCVQKRLATP